MNSPKDNDPARAKDGQVSFLQKQAWDYFNTHAAQRMAVFNFYIALSSLTAAGYVASFKTDSNLASERWIIALLLRFFAFVFWKLDQRVKFLIKNAENALRHFESGEPHAIEAKVFIQEEAETRRHRQLVQGWRRILFWRLALSYSHCFNLVYFAFFSIGAAGLVQAIYSHVHWCH
jgi:hypothetical protein